MTRWTFFLVCLALLLARPRPRHAGRCALALRPRPRRRPGRTSCASPPSASAPFRIRLDRLRPLRHDHRPRRRALRRPQPLRQPVHAVLAPVGRAHRLRHPRRRRPPVGPLAGAALYVLLEYALGRLTEHWQLFLGLILLRVVLFARGGLIGLVAGRRAMPEPILEIDGLVEVASARSRRPTASPSTSTPARSTP